MPAAAQARKDLAPRAWRREAVWAAIRELREFTRMDLQRLSKIEPRTIEEYVEGLLNAGFLEQVGNVSSPLSDNSGGFQRAVLRLVRDCGVEAPSVRKDGTILPPTGRARMWQAMRILKSFGPLDLSITASQGGPEVALSDAKSYCQFLAKAGYLRVFPLKKRAARYSLLQSGNTGPKPPQILRLKQLYDPNLGQIVWSSKPIGGDDE